MICPCQTNWLTGEYHDSKCPEAAKLRDSWCSPECVTELLPEVDLDPATNPRSKVKARRNIVWTHDPAGAVILGEPGRAKNELHWDFGDGLAIPWNGSVFLNGPYSDMLPWTTKANEEWGAGRLKEAIFLVKLDPTTRWWRQLMEDQDGTPEEIERQVDLWLPRKRLQHIPPPRIKASTNNFASAIVHWRRKSWSSTRGQLGLHSIADLWM